MGTTALELHSFIRLKQTFAGIKYCIHKSSLSLPLRPCDLFCFALGVSIVAATFAFLGSDIILLFGQNPC